VSDENAGLPIAGDDQKGPVSSRADCGGGCDARPNAVKRPSLVTKALQHSFLVVTALGFEISCGENTAVSPSKLSTNSDERVAGYSKTYPKRGFRYRSRGKIQLGLMCGRLSIASWHGSSPLDMDGSRAPSNWARDGKRSSKNNRYSINSETGQSPAINHPMRSCAPCNLRKNSVHIDECVEVDWLQAVPKWGLL